VTGAPTSDSPPTAGLTWAIKRRFIAYLAQLPDGAFSVADGATHDGGTLFTFPALAGAEPGRLGTLPLRFGGILRLSGHLGMLHVKIAAPRIETFGSVTVLTIADPDDEAPDRRVAFARLTLPDPIIDRSFVTWAGIDAALTTEGSELFGARYPEGEPLEPVTIRLPLPTASATRI
jgi:hypothetical protein